MNPFDVVALSGHADNQMQFLGNNYRFTPTPSVMTAMDQHLTTEGQVLILGCNTATVPPWIQEPLAEKVSQQLPDRFITGIASYFHRFATTNWYNNDFFHVQNYVFVQLTDTSDAFTHLVDAGCFH